MRRTTLIAFIISLCAWQYSHAQAFSVHINQLDSLMLHAPKPVLILLSTDWCSICASQKDILRKHKRFHQLSPHFYFVEFNGESRERVIYQGKEYFYRPSGVNVGSHELTQHLNDNDKAAYPTWILLSPGYQQVFKQKGLLNVLQLDELLTAMEKTFVQQNKK